MIRRAFISLAFFLAASCGHDCEDHMSDLIRMETYGPAMGIDQSENPRPGSVYDACNIDTSKGTWKLKPGARTIYSGQEFAANINGMVEYIPDSRYSTSHYYALLVCSVLPPLDGGQQRITEFKNSETFDSSGVGVPNLPFQKGALSHARGLWKDNDETESSKKYVPAIVFCDGKIRPFLYHQKGGEISLPLLDAIDGGDSSISYLQDPPIAKIFVTFKDRLFALNCPDGGNRVYHTGPDSSLVFVMNVWPSNYNFDVGSAGKAITGAKVFRDNLIIFKENEIWALSGDGVNGVWQLDLIDSEHGAVCQQAIVDVGDSLIFLSRKGICRWAGGVARNISHPRIEKLWKDYNWNFYRLWGAFDSSNNRVIFLAAKSTYLDSYIVYNIGNDSFDRWGTWPNRMGNFPELPHFISSDYTFGCILSADHWSGDGRNRVFVATGSGTLAVLLPDLYYDDYQAEDKRPIHWYMQSHQFSKRDNEILLARKAMVSAKKTGDWNLSLLALVDDEDVGRAIRRNAGTKWNFITDSADAQEHTVQGTSQFQTVADGPVDVYYVPVNHKLFDSRALLASSGADKIKFSSSLDSSNMAGDLLVIPEDKNPTKIISMLDSKITFDDVIYFNLEFSRIFTALNATGRRFSLWLSNVGNYHSGYDYAVLGMPFEMDGFGIWVRPKGVLR